jgi:hypothetical protein
MMMRKSKKPVKKTKDKTPNKTKFVFRVYDPAVQQSVVGVTINSWTALKRNTITTSQSEKTTTFFTPSSVAKVYENLLINHYKTSRLKGEYRRLRTTIEKDRAAGVVAPRPGFGTLSEKDRLEELALTLENVRQTTERGKNWQLLIGQIAFDSSEVSSPEEKQKYKEKISADIKADIKKRLIKAELEPSIDTGIVYDFLKSARHKNGINSSGVYLTLSAVRSYSELSDHLRHAGISCKVVSYSSWKPIIYIKDVADLNLIQLVTDSLKIEKQTTVPDLTKRYNKLSEKIEKDIKKYCGF